MQPARPSFSDYCTLNQPLRRRANRADRDLTEALFVLVVPQRDMERRRYLTALTCAISLAGCTGGRGDPITMLAVNEDDSAHSVTVWANQGTRLRVANTVDVASEEVENLGEMPWKEGIYRVTVRVDDEHVVAREFHSKEWFNQLDVFIASDGSVELHRGKAA